MQLTILFLLIAVVTQSFGDLLDGLEHNHHDHHEDHLDHHEEHLDHHEDQLEEVLDDHGLKSLDHDDSVPFSDDQYEEQQLLNEISRFLPREEFSVDTHDDDKSSEVSLFTHLTNPGKPKSFSIQEPVQQPLIVKQPIPEFGVPLKIIPPVQRQTTTIQEPSQEFGIPLQEIQAPQVEEQLIVEPIQPLLPVEPFAIIPEESFGFDSKETFGSSFEDLTNFLPHPEEEIVVIPNLPVVSNPPAVQKVVIQTPLITNNVAAPNPPSTKARVASPPVVKSTSLPRTSVKAVVPTNTVAVNVPDTIVADVVSSPAFDSLSSPSLSSDPSHSNFEDFSDNSIGGQGRQLGPARNELAPKSSGTFDLLDGDYPRYGPYPPVAREFKCEDHDVGGYFADPEFNCQVFHVCFDKDLLGTFLCPNGTLFNQQLFVCDWWFNVDCEEANSYYYLNENIGKVPEKKERFFEIDEDDDDFDD